MTGQKTPNELVSKVAAMLLGFLLADVLLVIILAPELAKPSNWTGVLSLTLSAAIMYAGLGLYMFVFYFFIRALNIALRLQFSRRALAIFSVVSSILFLILQEKLHSAILPESISPNSLNFYLPTAIAFALLAATMVATRYLPIGQIRPSGTLSRAFSWPGLIGTAFIGFFLYAGTFNMLNVLAVYPEEEQRDLRKEVIPVAPAAAAADAPNFIIVLIEAFRRDEFTPENVPFLWRLAQENIWLPNYHVVASATRPSTTSMFTSLYPAQHGVYNLAINQETADEEPVATTKVSDAIQSMPKLLQDNGYNTMMVTSNKLASDRVFGFEKVFNQFNATEPFEFKIPDPEPLLGYFILKNSLKRWRIFKALLFSPNHSRTYFDATRLNPVAEKLVAEKDKRPFLLYLHYIEPHTPYYHDPYQAAQIISLSREGMYQAYRQELSRIDRSFASLFASLESQGHLKNTWILITSDHGEEFYDHGNWGHGKSLYPEVIKVPAILIPPANHPGVVIPKQIDDTIESIDIAPTFGEVAGLTPPEYWEGTSLMPLLEGNPTAPRDTALSQFNDGRYLWSAAIVGDWQIIYREPQNAIELDPSERLQERTVMLFNIASDPLAKEDVVNKQPEKTADMTERLDAELHRLETSAILFQGEKEEVNKEQLEQLRALGYID